MDLNFIAQIKKKNSKFEFEIRKSVRHLNVWKRNASSANFQLKFGIRIDKFVIHWFIAWIGNELQNSKFELILSRVSLTLPEFGDLNLESCLLVRFNLLRHSVAGSLRNLPAAVVFGSRRFPSRLSMRCT